MTHKPNCTWTKTKRNGKKGYEVKGKNGNSMFLPAAGYRYGTVLYNASSYYGYYLSSSLSASSPDHVIDLVFGAGGVLPVGWYYRFMGQSVRAVRCRN